MSTVVPRRRTLRGRVSALALLVIAGWLVLLAGGFDLLLVSRLDQQVDDELRVRAQAASATVILRDGHVTGVRESATDSELDSSIWVYSGRHSVARPDLPPPLLRAADSAASGPVGDVDHAGHRFRVLPIRVDGHRVGSVVAAIDLAPYHRTRDLALAGSAVVAALLLAGAYPVLRFAAGRALEPVARMTDQAAEWSVTSPAQRFGGRQRYAELDALAGRLDELLDRLSAVLRHERRLSAELSHELRTPLARVSAQADLLLPDARPDQRDELLALRDNCAAMEQIIDTLLRAARSELTRTIGRCAVRDVLGELAGTGWAEDGPAVLVSADDITVGVEAATVSRILAPVVENARRFAESEIRLSAHPADGAVAIEVSNDGPPLPATLSERVFEPGFRAADGRDEWVADGVADGHDGAGLGLALARRLARSADGELTVDADAARTTFRLVLPAG